VAAATEDAPPPGLNGSGDVEGTGITREDLDALLG
jgi:hypothetical protein